MAKRVKLGDVLQVLTSEGLAYAQVTHKHVDFGFLIRVFPGFNKEAPQDFAAVVADEPQFSTFFPVQAAVTKGLISVVANVPIVPALASFPMFRMCGGGPGGSLWLWDGLTETMLKRPFTAEEMHYPDRCIISAPMLVQRIEQGYRAHTHDIW